MHVIFAPRTLRLAVFTTLLCIPLAALETVIAARAPWWRLPWRSMQLWSLVVALLCVPVSLWIMAGHRWAVKVIGIFGVVWCMLSVLLSLKNASVPLGFFTVLLCGFWWASYSWLKCEIERSFFDPRMSWYEDLPRAIPEVLCAYGDKIGLRVCRLDADGAFIFSNKDALAVKSGDHAVLTFGFRDKAVECHGVPVRVLRGDRGIGFQFRGMSPDAKKKLGDFIEILRGEGHA